MQKNRAIAFRSGLTWGIILALCELAFGVVVYSLLPILGDYLKSFQIDLLVPVATVYLAYLFLLLAVYFTCGMITAKWLAPTPLKSWDTAKLGAMSGAVAEVTRSLVAVPVNLAIAILFPVARDSTNPLLVLLGNAALRLFCGLPAFVFIAALVAGVSAYIFSLIFFKPDTTAQQETS